MDFVFGIMIGAFFGFIILCLILMSKEGKK